MVYIISISADGLTEILEMDYFDVTIMKLYQALAGVSKKTLVVEGQLLQLPNILNDLSVFAVEHLPDIFSFLKDDVVKEDTYFKMVGYIENEYKRRAGMEVEADSFLG